MAGVDSRRAQGMATAAAGASTHGLAAFSALSNALSASSATALLRNTELLIPTHPPNHSRPSSTCTSVCDRGLML
jgi:hypothetical protein